MKKILLLLLLSTGLLNPVFALDCFGDDWSDLCIQKHTYPSGDYYFGQWDDNQAHGIGHYFWATGEKYYGHFENNQFNGKGQYQASETNYISGIWEKGEFLYEHKITLVDIEGFKLPERCHLNKYAIKDDVLINEAYCGLPDDEEEPLTQNQLNLIASMKKLDTKECFGNGTKSYKYYIAFHNCKGIWEFNMDHPSWPGATYTGEWKNGKPDGNGSLIYRAGSKSEGTDYVGEFKNGMVHGYGVSTSGKGDIYRGQWLNDKANGQGFMSLADGTVLEGEFKNNKLNGQGIAIGANGNREEGRFENGQLVFGKASFPSGAIYEGQFVGKSLVEGKIIFTKSGNTQEGKFSDGSIVEGKVTFADSGDTYEGTFDKDGDLIEGKVIFGDSGSIYEGLWNKDYKLTEGTITFKDGETHKGVFNNDGDIINGIIILADGSVTEITNGSTKPNVQITENNIADDEIIPAASGSGFAVTSDGYVVTNYHVIEGCNSVEVYENNQPIAAVVVNFDLNNDIALLKANFKPNHYFPLRSKNPSLLMDIYAAGYPFGYDISTPVKVTQGIVSSLSGVGNNYSNIQIDAAIQPGNSGGPIIDKKGNVVAVAVATLDLEEVYEAYGVIPEGTNFGIKSNVVINFLESNNVQTSEPNTRNVSTESLGRMISDGTYYISCLMTMAQINNLRERKVMFSDLK